MRSAICFVYTGWLITRTRFPEAETRSDRLITIDGQYMGSLPYSRTARFFVKSHGCSVRRGEFSGLFLRKVLKVLKHKQIILVAVWLLAVGLGLHTLLRYTAKAGNAGQPPSTWPSNTLVSSPLHKPLLVMFAHPRCPCTKASLGDLAPIEVIQTFVVDETKQPSAFVRRIIRLR